LMLIQLVVSSIFMRKARRLLSSQSRQSAS
jgi:hypothetical protein